MKQETNHVWAPTGFGVDDMGECVRSTINFLILIL